MQEFILNKEILSVSGLTKSFGTTEAVKDISFSVSAGEMFGMVGPDGAGKTTTLKAICGLLTPDSGDILLFNEKVKRSGKSTQKRIGYLSQRFSLYGDLSVDENLDFFAKIHGRKDYHEERKSLLEMTRLSEFTKRPAEKLSGGMKQKLALACSLIHKPDLLILDEPTTGVDPVSRRDFWKILSQLRLDGLTIIMSTPYLDEAERCDRVALFNQGRILSLDNPVRMKETCGFRVYEISTSSIREADILIRNNFAIVPQLYGDRLHIIVDSESTLPEKILSLLAQNGISVLSSEYIIPSLENIFIKAAEVSYAE